MTDNFLQEIEEEVRVEKALKFWHTYQNHILGVIVGIAVIYGGYTYWSYKNHQTQLEISQQLMDMVTDYKEGKGEEAELVYEKLKDKRGYGALARLLKASHMGTILDQSEEAIKIYKDLSNQSSQDKKFRDLAKVLEVLHRMNNEKPDDTAELLEKISKDSSNPWHGTAMELQAVVEVKKGNKDKGLELLNKLADDAAVSEAIRMRAKALHEQFSK